MPPRNPYARQAEQGPSPPPSINVRYFYTSPLAIDDPLAAVPPPLTGSSLIFKSPPRPFSDFDNTALDKAWREVRQQALEQAELSRNVSSTPLNQERPQISSSIPVAPKRRSPLEPSPTSSPAARPSAITSASSDGSRLARGFNTSTESSVASSYIDGISPFDSISKTRNPFIRAPVRIASAAASRSASMRPVPQVVDSYNWEEDTFVPEDQNPDSFDAVPKALVSVKQEAKAKVLVGVSRLHNVGFPNCQLEPIYWSPVGDIAPVIRGTWFYHDNMLPVEPVIANLIELGYLQLRVWSETWGHELNSAVEAGAAGEMKILHKLWPTKLESLKPNSDSLKNAEKKSDQDYAAGIGDSMDYETRLSDRDHKAAGSATWGKEGTPKLYKTAGVIYADSSKAYLLRPNLQPSDYYNRRPLANFIRKNREIGICVTRGFDEQRWNQLYPAKKSSSANASPAPAPEVRLPLDSAIAESEVPKVTDLIFVIHGIGQKLSERVESYHFTHAMNSLRRELNVELADEAVKRNIRKEMGGIMLLPINWRHTLSFEDGGYREETDSTTNTYSLADITPDTLLSVRNIVSDVMLDIPYYLTPGYHDKMIAAVVNETNSIYRRWCINNPGFAQHGKVHIIAHSLGSVMALDILSSQPTTVTLPKPITDLSITELPKEHFAFDTSNLYLAGSPAGFFLLLKRVGLLPRHGCRKVRNEIDDLLSPQEDNESLHDGSTGEQGKYGCLPVDNLYNIINPYDPVAYCLNAAVDADYAAALKKAWIPSHTRSWFNALTFSSPSPAQAAPSSTMNSVSSPTTTILSDDEPPAFAKRRTILKPFGTRTPSTVELETHNFSREEVAERKAYQLNDNGQIDFYLRYGGGPLEIQYLTMLGAHSSYWLSRDFIRLIAVETGRGLGRSGTMPEMRAVKMKKKKL